MLHDVLSRIDQNEVSRLMSVRVVNDLEVVQVYHDDAARHDLARHRRLEFAQDRKKAASVIDSLEWIDGGQHVSIPRLAYELDASGS